MTLKRGLIVK